MRRDRRSEDCVLEPSRSHPAGVNCRTAKEGAQRRVFAVFSLRFVILSAAKDLSSISARRPSRHSDKNGCATMAKSAAKIAHAAMD